MPKKKSTKKAVKKTAKKTVKKTATKKNSAKPATHNRAPGKTQISISLPADLVGKIDALAAAQNRNRSNFIATELERIAEA